MQNRFFFSLSHTPDKSAILPFMSDMPGFIHYSYYAYPVALGEFCVPLIFCVFVGGSFDVRVCMSCPIVNVSCTTRAWTSPMRLRMSGWNVPNYYMSVPRCFPNKIWNIHSKLLFLVFWDARFPKQRVFQLFDFFGELPQIKRQNILIMCN